MRRITLNTKRAAWNCIHLLIVPSEQPALEQETCQVSPNNFNLIQGNIS